MEQTLSFHGPTTSDAMAAVKRSLGKDAVIITLRERPGDPARRYEIDATRGDGPETRDPSESRGPREARDTAAVTRAAVRAPAPTSRPRFEPTVVRPATPRSPLVSVDADASFSSPLSPPRDAGGPDLRVLESLDRAGIDPLVRGRMLERALRLQRVGESPLTALRTAFLELLGTAPAPWHLEGQARRVVALVGPTGAGKTTTLAKIAAQAVIEKRRVAMITTDTWRVGAAQHLTRYGEIMGVSTYVAASDEELASAIHHARAYDLVLIDTAGRSPRSLRDPVQWRNFQGVEVHLVVPVGTSAAQMTAIRQRHHHDAPVAVICTKLDEVDAAHGASGTVNAAALLGLPIAATNDGQTVPDDVAAFDAGALWRRLGGAR